MDVEREMIRRANLLAAVISVYNKGGVSLGKACENTGVKVGDFHRCILGSRVVWVVGEEGGYAIGLAKEEDEGGG